MFRPASDERLLIDVQGNRRQLAKLRAAAANSPYRRRLRVEPLEDRRLLATITVNTLIDVNANDGLTTLREAITAAAASDTITFSVNGTINLTSLGQLTINKNLTISGPGSNLLTIQAYNPSPTVGNGSRVFNIDDGTSTVRTVAISGVTLAGGDVTGDGGAIRSLETLTVTNSTISGSAATANGGGIFSSNRNLVVTGSTISGNSAKYGGGINCNKGTLTVTGSTISGNVTTTDDGAGIYSLQCPVNITSSTISGNSAPGDGGGIFADATTVTVTSSTLSGNSAYSGGGVYSNESTLTVTNSTISGNQVTNSGGGIYGYKGNVTVTHSTITANRADSDNNGSGVGGGVRDVSTGTEAFRHTILALNTRGAATRSDASGPIELQYSLIGDNTGATVANSGGNLIGTSAAPINPLLGLLANNGGPTFTHALLTGSPAIDAGNASAVAGANGIPPFDQRGTPYVRVADGDGNAVARIDIGAIELLPVSNHSPTNPAAVTLAAINEDTPNASNTGTLVSAIVTASSSTDSDGNSLGIAVTAADNSHGQWQYSTNGGGAWLDLTSVSTASARLLAPAHLVRFVPSADFNSQVSASPTIGFKVWDQTSGTAGSTADTTSNNAYSASAAQATQPVTAVNDAPSFTLAATPVQRNEDAGAVTVSSFATNMARGPATATDESAQTLTFLVTVTGTTGNLAFSTAPAINSATGALTFTTAANTNGTATVEVALQDGGSGTAPNVNTSAVQQFSIQIAAVNDAPSFTLPATPVQRNEDDGAVTVSSFATNIARGPATATDESAQTLTFLVSVSGTTGNLAFTAAPAINSATGALTFTTAANTNGTATVDVTLQDGGSGTAPNVNTSAVQQFSIQIAAVNDAPSFTLSATPVQRNEDAGAVTVSSFATNIARGPATATDESAQTLTFLVSVSGTTGNLAFTAAPAINSATGALTFTTAPNTNGTATVDVTLQDGGSGTAPNVNASAVQQFSIQIAAVNDEQVLATNNLLTLDRGSSAVITAAFLETTDIDDAPSDLVYAVTSIPTHRTLLVGGTPVEQFTQQQISAGQVSYQHDGTATLADSFAFTVDDGEGTTSSGTFQITIRPFAGDYNANRTVDAADYVVWRKTLNTGPIPAYSGADGNGDMAVDQYDYVVWRANFGNAMPAAAASGARVTQDTVSGEQLGTDSAWSTTGQVSTGILPSNAAASAHGDIAAGAAIDLDDTNAQAPNQRLLVGVRPSSVASPAGSTSHDALLAWLSSYATSEHPDDGDTLGLRGDAQGANSDTVITLDLLDEVFASLAV